MDHLPHVRPEAAEAEKRVADEYDSPWKEVVEIFFEDMMALLFPALTNGTSGSKSKGSRRNAGCAT